jgi:hypothetical protein
MDFLARGAECLIKAGAPVGASDHGTTKARYAKDPNGIEFEVCWLVPADHITEELRTLRVQELDINAEIARYGADHRSGRPLPRWLNQIQPSGVSRWQLRRSSRPRIRSPKPCP